LGTQDTQQSDRWDKAEDARTNGPKELKFEANSNDYTAEFSKLCAMRLYQAVKHAKQTGGSSVALGTDTTTSLVCSKLSLKKQFKHCMKGDIGFFTSRQIISLLPETDECLIKKRKTLAQAFEGDDEEESRANPTTMRQQYSLRNKSTYVHIPVPSV
jgi:hypothetical protein